MSERMRVITNEEVDSRISELEEQFPATPQYEYALVKPEKYTVAEVDQRFETNIDTIEKFSTPEEREGWKKVTMFKHSGDDQVIWKLTKM